MIKIIGRIAIILVAAAIISGGLYLFVAHAGQSGLLAGRGREFEVRDRQFASQGGSGVQSFQRSAGDRSNAGSLFQLRSREFDEEGEGRFGFAPLRGLLVLARNSVVIGMIIAGVVVAQKMIVGLFRRRYAATT